jgi:hypothetical protein
MLAQRAPSNFERWDAAVGPLIKIIQEAILPKLDPGVLAKAKR